MGIRGKELYSRARQIIPGGTQLLSKRPEMFLPEQWPSYYSKASGVEIWGLDNEKYIDMSYCGIGTTILGYADPDVNKAVHRAVDAGTMTTLNCPEEVELAELLCDLHPWAEQVRFARTGGEAMSIAIRIARASTGRDKIVFCGYHGWHDWYLAANLGEEDDRLDGHLLPGLEPKGVPRGLAGTALPFHYNNSDELRSIVTKNNKQIAAIVMEPVRNRPPAPGFLESVRKIAREAGAVLIYDEITSGWRMNTGGIHLLYNTTPDIAVFAKAISNGFPMAAVIGVSDVMEAVQSTFVSSTYWTERIGPVAALATIHKHQNLDVPMHLVEIGNMVQTGWKKIAQHFGLDISVDGIPPLAHFTFRGYEDSQAMLTLFIQTMLEQGFLAKNSFYAMYAHEPSHIKQYLNAVEHSFSIIATALQKNNISEMLNGPVAHSGFHRLT